MDCIEKTRKKFSLFSGADIIFFASNLSLSLFYFIHSNMISQSVATFKIPLSLIVRKLNWHEIEKCLQFSADYFRFSRVILWHFILAQTIVALL